MENRLQYLFLTLLLTLGTNSALAQSDDESGTNSESVLEAVINPDLERRDIIEAKVDSENFEFGLFTGVMSVEDFGTNDVYGVRAAFHITEDLFMEAAYGTTTTTETSYELLSGGTPLLTEDQRTLNYYNLSVGINLLPGEVFVGRKYAFNTAYYVIGGAGNTQFGDNEYFTYNFGGGFRLFFTDWVALRLDVRNHLFTHNLLGEDKSIQNLETHLGLSLYF
ncbi:outer membrane beta-barrel domain-containing protein [Teredinibacter waterburyi]|jgi:hypothetical protein|uniref:outer membrane beta-barrel domain-containing protein n=1 Tax=Teredinibacter waterburyi TaxID=1500538 RepID=UPI00165FF57B|nr:outer membrane beta-barrel domain-containing protein [Teredinibacter waterburyi]